MSEVYLRTSQKETRNIFDYGKEVGFYQTLVDLGLLSMNISRNQAKKMVGGTLLKSWENDGLIEGISLGNGKTSTILYDRMKIVHLWAYHRMKIKKAYNIK